MLLLPCFELVLVLQRLKLQLCLGVDAGFLDLSLSAVRALVLGDLGERSCVGA